jgi:hypothetical protein
MKIWMFIKILALQWLAFGLMSGLPVLAEQPAAKNQAPISANSVITKVFSHGVPTGWESVQAGELTKQEGEGNFLVLTTSNKMTKLVIVELEKLSWLKTKEVESANPVKVGNQLIKRFFPEALPVAITEDQQGKKSDQFASPLRITSSKGVSEPAIALRLIYSPKAKGYILLLWQQQTVQNFSLSYQQLESQAKVVLKELKVPAQTGTTVSDRYMLWRLRHIFKKGVFTHLAPTTSN